MVNISYKRKMSKKKKNDNIYLKIMLAMIIFIISIVMIIKTSNVSPNVLVSYNTTSNMDYKIYLFSNDYIKSEYMEKGKTYITSLVNKISLSYDFTLKSSKKLDSNYKYDVVAKITVKHNSTGKELWTEETKLVSDKETTAIADCINFQEDVEIPYKDFNDKVKSFKTQYNIPILAYLDVNLVVKDANTDSELVSTGISMDLNEDTFEISEVSAGNQVKTITEVNDPNKVVLVLECIVAVISGLYLVYNIYNVIDSSGIRKTYYSKAIYKILKNYGDIVAELVRPVDLSGLKVIDVKNFDQMLDVEEELRIPIMFYETVKNEEGHFVLVHQDMAYRYILKDKFRN